jgi:hypothetical protein
MQEQLTKNGFLKWLEVMLEHQNLFRSGLCNWIYHLRIRRFITSNEYEILKKYIRENKPPVYSSWSSFKTLFDYPEYYWGFGEINPRLKWINKHIKIN